MDTEDNPANIPGSDLRLLVNARWRPDGMICRGGIAPFFEDPLHGDGACLYLSEFEIGTPKRLWAIVDGCPGESLITGISTIHVDPEQEPQVQGSVWYQAFTTAVIGSFGGIPHLGLDDALRRIQLIQVPYGTPNLAQSGGSQDLPLETFAGYTITAIKECPSVGLLFVALDGGGAGLGKIVTWDGKTLRDDITGIDAVTSFGLWRDNLVAGFGGATAHIRIRDTQGNWTTVAAAGFACNASANAITSFKDTIVIASGATKLWTSDGATLTNVHTIGGATIQCVENAFGFLYYGYGPQAKIGQSPDLVAFTDVHKNLFAQASVAGATDVRAMILFRDHLAAGILKAGTTYIAQSRADDTSGTWDTLPTSAGDIRHFVVM